MIQFHHHHVNEIGDYCKCHITFSIKLSIVYLLECANGLIWLQDIEIMKWLPQLWLPHFIRKSIVNWKFEEVLTKCTLLCLRRVMTKEIQPRVINKGWRIGKGLDRKSVDHGERFRLEENDKRNRVKCAY